MTSFEISNIVSRHFNLDIFRRSQKREVIYARGICNKLCKTYTEETLESIGKYYNVGHATVIHSLKEFDNNYVYQKTPFDVEDAFTLLDEFVGNIIQEESVVIEMIKDHQFTHSDYRFLSDRCISLSKALRKAKKEYDDLLNDGLFVTKEYKPLFDILKGMSKAELSELEDTRLKPFKKMLESRKNRKKIVKIQGALINR